MRVLILEDDDLRCQAFRRRFSGHEVVVIVRAAQDAIRLLREQVWDLLCLDHDLGDCETPGSSPGTGYEVAEWIAEHEDRRPARIVLHSFNPVGVANMKRALGNAVIAPGFWAQE